MDAVIFDLAVQPGRQSVRRGAASALLAAADKLDPVIVGGITAPLLATRFEPVAARDVAGQLTTNHKRRVLLLLVVWLMKERNPNRYFGR